MNTVSDRIDEIARRLEDRTATLTRADARYLLRVAKAARNLRDAYTLAAVPGIVDLKDYFDRLHEALNDV